MPDTVTAFVDVVSALRWHLALAITALLVVAVLERPRRPRAPKESLSERHDRLDREAADYLAYRWEVDSL